MPNDAYSLLVYSLLGLFILIICYLLYSTFYSKKEPTNSNVDTSTTTTTTTTPTTTAIATQPVPSTSSSSSSSKGGGFFSNLMNPLSGNKKSETKTTTTTAVVVNNNKSTSSDVKYIVNFPTDARDALRPLTTDTAKYDTFIVSVEDSNRQNLSSYNKTYDLFFNIGHRDFLAPLVLANIGSVQVKHTNNSVDSVMGRGTEIAFNARKFNVAYKETCMVDNYKTMIYMKFDLTMKVNKPESIIIPLYVFNSNVNDVPQTVVDDETHRSSAVNDNSLKYININIYMQKAFFLLLTKIKGDLNGANKFMIVGKFCFDYRNIINTVMSDVVYGPDLHEDGIPSGLKALKFNNKDYNYATNGLVVSKDLYNNCNYYVDYSFGNDDYNVLVARFSKGKEVIPPKAIKKNVPFMNAIDDSLNVMNERIWKWSSNTITPSEITSANYIIS